MYVQKNSGGMLKTPPNKQGGPPLKEFKLLKFMVGIDALW